MREITTELQDVVRSTSDRLFTMPDEVAKQPLAAGKWSRKEVLGHLIDSAANNHQRFVRAAIKTEYRSPGYHQSSWVALQKYQEESWSDLITLWKAYNLHIAHVIEAIPDDGLGDMVVVGENAPVTLQFLIEDYVDHLKKHVATIR